MRNRLEIGSNTLPNPKVLWTHTYSIIKHSHKYYSSSLTTPNLLSLTTLWHQILCYTYFKIPKSPNHHQLWNTTIQPPKSSLYHSKQPHTLPLSLIWDFWSIWNPFFTKVNISCLPLMYSSANGFLRVDFLFLLIVLG